MLEGCATAWDSVNARVSGVSGLGFRVLGLRVLGLVFRISGLGPRVWGFRICGSGGFLGSANPQALGLGLWILRA